MVIHGLDINLADVGKGRRLREAENAGEYHNRNGHRADAFAGHLTSVFVRRKSDYAFYRREAGRARLRVLLTLVMKAGACGWRRSPRRMALLEFDSCDLRFCIILGAAANIP